MSVFAILDDQTGDSQHVDTKKAERAYIGDTGEQRYWENLYRSSKRGAGTS